jgi:hypothetical protein
MRRLANFLNKQLVPVFQASRWKRLHSDIQQSKLESNGIRASRTKNDELYKVIDRSFEHAFICAARGDIDEGWKCLHVARRLEILNEQTDELIAVKMRLDKESTKLTSWRKEAVTALLGEVTNNKPCKAKIYQAAALLDGHYDNMAYKDHLQLINSWQLTFILILIFMSWIYWKFPKPDSDLFVAFFGVLGATISAIFAMLDTKGSPRIPEMVSTIRITFLRLIVGPVAAIIICYFVKADFCKSVFTDKFCSFVEKNEITTTTIIAFVAGFSGEKLVRRVVENVLKKTA